MTLKNPIDNDRLALFRPAERKEYLRQCHEYDGGANDAELVAEMKRSGDLKSVAIPAVPSVRVAREPEPLPPGYLLVNGRIYHASKLKLPEKPVVHTHNCDCWQCRKNAYA